MATSKRDYLKRYQSVEEKEKKPKKSKKRKAASTKALGGVVIVDSDAGWQKNIDEDDEEDAEIEEGADGPQVIEDVEVKRMHQMERLKQHRPYMSIGDDGSGWVNVKANIQDSSPPRRRRNDSPEEEERGERRIEEQRSQPPDLSPQRRVSSAKVSSHVGEHDMSPPRRRRSQIDVEDMSPPRKMERGMDGREKLTSSIDGISPPRRRQSGIDSEDMSPSRKRESGMDRRKDAHGIRKNVASYTDDISPPRRRQSRIESKDLSPQRRISSARVGSDVGKQDMSPPRKRQSRIDDEDMSPPRKREREVDGRKDANGMREKVMVPSSIDDLSPPRRRQSRIDSKDLSPQRRISSVRVGSDVGKQDMSPPRRRQSRIDDEDMSPPRKRGREVDGRNHANGMRKKVMVPSSIDDLSPPRRRQWGIDVEDMSPPRKKEGMVDYKKSGNGVEKNDDVSPPRRRPSRMVSEDISPPRRRENSKYVSESTIGGTGNKRLDSPDISPPRRRRQRMDSPGESAPRRDMPPPHKIGTNPIGAVKKTKMTDGRQAGLTSDVDLAAELVRKKRDEAQRMKEMEPSVSGRGAETIYRDKRGKRLEGLEELLRQQQGEVKPEVKPLEWGKGLAQKREVEQQKAEYDAEKSKPFARSRDDPELDKLMKDRLRWGDPMAHLVKTKDPEAMLVDLGATDEMKESGFIIPQDVPKHSWLKRGIGAPMNRYGIKPGRHWDGVDRSTGFEAQMFKAKAEKQANELEAYMWSVADM